MGAGRMGSWLAKVLCTDHDVAVYDKDREKVECLHHVGRVSEPGAVGPFEPELVVNAVGLRHIRQAFGAVLPHLPGECMLSDIASVKAGLLGHYRALGRRFVSTHPMFGPTFSDLRDPRGENAIIIEESDPEGKVFFRDFYEGLNIHVHEYTFEEHDKAIAYSLSIPFVSSMVFAASMKKQEAPGTTFRKHVDIARGLLSEDDTLLAEVLFSPYSIGQIEEIGSKLTYLTHIIRSGDYEEMEKFLKRLRVNVQGETRPLPSGRPGPFREGKAPDRGCSLK